MSKVLVVEDEKEIVETIKDLLQQRLLCEVDVAYNGLDGFLMAQKNEYDLILTDHKMPFMLGSALIVAIRSKETASKNAPIIFLSAYISDELKNSLKVDGLHFMEKPFDTKEFITALRAWG